MTSKEIRQKYLEFFKQRGHNIIPSFSLIPENDPSLLFVNSGMFPLVLYLLGEKHPLGKCLADSQKSFRAEDIDEVGDNRHNTFFEMLGNWSLGDYFKQEQLNWWFEFILDELKLDPSRIYQTVYAGDDVVSKDEDSIQILKNIFNKYEINAGTGQCPVPAEEGPTTLGKGSVGPGVPVDFKTQRIFAYRDKNWWQRGDAIGELGGPDSETFYDTGKEHDPKYGKYCHVNCDCGRFLEIGNSVFMQYQKTETGWGVGTGQCPVPTNVDFGGGLERITMVVQGKKSVFETDLFSNIINKIEELSGKKYNDNMKAFEIIADHLKAVTFVMGDDQGVAPSNVDRGYIVRRLIRRAIRYGKQLGIQKELWTKEIAEVVVHDYENIYPELRKNIKFITEQLDKEEEKFNDSLVKNEQRKNKRLEILLRITRKEKKEEDKKWLENDSRIAKKEILKDWEHLKELDNKKLSNLLANVSASAAFTLETTYGYPHDLFFDDLALRMSNEEEWLTKTTDIYVGNLLKEAVDIFLESFSEHQELSRTASSGKFKGGLADVSEQTTKYHTATHLLNAALRKVLGEYVHQKGSNITAERLRFDFFHPEKMTPEQIKQVEDIVNEQIQKNISVTMEETTVEEAKKQGAIGVFESKYGDKVKVYTIANSAKAEPPFSREICGGPHVESTGVLGKFKIIKEQASSAGVRRIKAILEYRI